MMKVRSKKHVMPNILVTNVRSIVNKTDELECDKRLLGAVNGNEIGQLIVDGNSFARVSTFKLLGI